jgi:hypothetical protein
LQTAGTAAQPARKKFHPDQAACGQSVHERVFATNRA